MKFELTLKFYVDSVNDRDRVAKLLESVFEFGTVKEAIAEGLHLLKDPQLLSVRVRHNSKRKHR